MKFLLLLTLLILASSCSKRAPKPRKQTVFPSTIPPEKFVGTWRMSAEGIDYLIKNNRLSVFTNQNDHVVVLQADGHATFKGFFASYSRLWNPEWEREHYEILPQEEDEFNRVYTWTNCVWDNVIYGKNELVAMLTNQGPDSSPWRFFVRQEGDDLYLWKPGEQKYNSFELTYERVDEGETR